MQLPEAILETDLEGLQLVSRGKVRDIYALGENLLIVTSDRISAYDSILPTGIPAKGMVLTALTEFWLSLMRAATYNHLITTDVDAMGDAVAPHREVLAKRSMLVRRAEVLPVECVVRGYLAGSGWRSYKKDGTVCGIKLPDGLQQADKLPEPIFTPTTKAEEGHDLPMTMDEVREELGEDLANQVRDKSMEVYTKAADYARERGIIICDTKFEWGLVDGNLTLVDEVLTPDSSRFWPAEDYEPGKSQKSYDKQYVRDWLDESGWDHEPPAPELPDEVVQKTAEKYLKACSSLTGGTPLDED
jgi:phosphoribosylaminoimidazole-succinocarboxamide synthase